MPESPKGHIGDRIAELGSIERVKELRSELEALRFLDSEGFAQGHVPIVLPRSEYVAYAVRAVSGRGASSYNGCRAVRYRVGNERRPIEIAGYS